MAAQPLTLGQRAADFVAAFIGSWSFLAAFNAFVLFWCALQHTLGAKSFDPYPYILLNLVFSWLAGVYSPVIMISQNRQEQLMREQLDIMAQQVRHTMTLQEAIHAHILATNAPPADPETQSMEVIANAPLDA